MANICGVIWSRIPKTVPVQSNWPPFGAGPCRSDHLLIFSFMGITTQLGAYVHQVLIMYSTLPTQSMLTDGSCEVFAEFIIGELVRETLSKLSIYSTGEYGTAIVRICSVTSNLGHLIGAYYYLLRIHGVVRRLCLLETVASLYYFYMIALL